MFLLNDTLIVCALVKGNRQTSRADKNSQHSGRKAWSEELLPWSLGFSLRRRLEAVRRAESFGDVRKLKALCQIKDFCPLGMTLIFPE